MTKMLMHSATFFAAITSALLLVIPPQPVQAEDVFDQVFGNAGSSNARGFRGMTGQQLRSIVSDRKVFLTTPIGAELAITYAGNGTMTGAGGKLAKYLSAKKLVVNDKGKWWISRNRLCQKWQNWLKGKLTCIKARKVGRKVYWQADNGDKGTARLGPKVSKQTRALPAQKTAQNTAQNTALAQ